MELAIVENKQELYKAVSTHRVACMVVSLRPDPPEAQQEKNYLNEDLKDFLNIAASCLEPEHADVTIIYSCEKLTGTPPKWPDGADPRPIKNQKDLESVDIHLNDTDWKLTITKIARLKQRLELAFEVSEKSLEIAVSLSNVRFPLEAIFLLRAAFKEMSKIQVQFPPQGFSGSLVYIVRPTDRSGNKCRSLVTKLYPLPWKAEADLHNWGMYVAPYLASEHYPSYRNVRYRGRIYSILVMEQMGGYKDCFTLGEMIKSDVVTVEEIERFVEDLLMIMDYGDLQNKDLGWKTRHNDKRLDLIDVYLEKALDSTKDAETYARVDSNNICKNWFGDFADGLAVGDKIRASTRSNYLYSTSYKVCHGDLHADNIAARSHKGVPVPALIDFSQTSETHSLKDLVTLEADMIIRGLNGIKAFACEESVSDLLESLPFEIEQIPDETKWATGENEPPQLRKVLKIIQKLRINARDIHEASASEYETAAMLHALKILSFGNGSYDEVIRATTYVSHLVDRLKTYKNGDDRI